ncbi:glycine cleavage system protein GcvH [Pseudonocardia hispaniensis]|uniref:Glycine cleavage system H protein n=1 Tax=Pseudonocardia hispaniensis TaxID=904933 RepID=A0ABW1J7T4_9PSEU
MIPEDLRYTDAHEWVRELGDRVVRVGITDYAQQQLGDVVFVQLPAVGETFAAGDVLGEVESTKSVSDIYAPLPGEVVAVNEALEGSPELINSGPYEAGWMIELKLAEGASASLDDLLDAAAYQQLTEGS